MPEQVAPAASKSWKRMLWSILCAFIASAVLSSFWWPFGADQTIFARAGDESLRSGDDEALLQ